MEYDEKLPIVPSNWTNNRKHFFKYMSASTAKIVLANRTLRWSTPALLNDPFDIQFNMNVSADPATVKALALERLWDVVTGKLEPHPGNPLGQLFKLLRDSGIKLPREELIIQLGGAFEEGFARMLASLPELNAEAAKLLADTKVFCLTIRPDNLLMWSHYADSHRGVVLRFRSIPAIDSPFGIARPVSYVQEVPPLLTEAQVADIFAGAGSLQDAGILDRTLYTKSLEWAYEQEWRVSPGSGWQPQEPFEDIKFGQDELDGIIFGLRTSAIDRHDMTTLGQQYPNVEMFATSRASSSFGLTIDHVHIAS